MDNLTSKLSNKTSNLKTDTEASTQKKTQENRDQKVKGKSSLAKVPKKTSRNMAAISTISQTKKLTLNRGTTQSNFDSILHTKESQKE